jgi:hypothetical protein
VEPESWLPFSSHLTARPVLSQITPVQVIVLYYINISCIVHVYSFHLQDWNVVCPSELLVPICQKITMWVFTT